MTRSLYLCNCIDNLSLSLAQEFEDMSLKYDSVRKFTKSNLKPLKNVESFFSAKAGSLFLVAIVDGQVSGCVGVRVAFSREKEGEVNKVRICVDY